MILLQLSSISSLFNISLAMNAAEVQQQHPELLPAEVAGVIMIGAVLRGYQCADPHWNTIRTTPNHWDNGIDEGCRQIIHRDFPDITDEMLASIETLPEERRDTFQRIVTSSQSATKLLWRLKREDARRTLSVA